MATVVKSVLIVDDNRFFRQMLAKYFQSDRDFEVCGEAENGKEAVAKAMQLHPDLIVLDLSMPVMNGLDAARVLRLLMPTVPLIMNSADADILAEQQARVIGVSEIVPKSAQELLRRARHLIHSEHTIAA